MLGLVSLALLAALAASEPAHSHTHPPAEPTGTRLEVDLSRYPPLETLDGARQAAQEELDRKVFDLSAMSPGYLRAVTVAPTYLKLPVSAFFLPEPPENSSARTRAELDELLRLQATARSAAAVARAQELARVYYRLSTKPGDADWDRMQHNLFKTGDGLGESFGPETLPETAHFMARVWADATFYIWSLKFRYNRIRPHRLEPRLEALEDANFPAYPSGHSSNSFVAALVYAELLPEHRELFLRNAGELAFSRELLGVHYASDSTSGRRFAEKFLEEISKVPAFERDLEVARKEIVAAGLVGATAKQAHVGPSCSCPKL